ncbi:low affinity immunoglobulin gamma Fc region receptor II-a-like isoform X2 [Epinephelus moara]|uniref:low affinity immunoglobulin gamma Fc region receptor II-a-like isoform X2 n=1 Tax=Epinephelus moara TaxID=300413 RepID=UPI00214F5FD3|nr:low affinity immunoglobulin gamma Fc region receptor II-a-like isoform X2 [Epinephelus moara]
MQVTALCVALMVNVLLLLTDEGQSSSSVHRSDACVLHVDPNRLQFFEYDSISFKCRGFHGSSEWRVMRKVSSNVSQWDSGFLNITPAFETHSGEYWCENAEGDRSNAVNITVTAGDVILESPALPVMERQAVSLRCRRKMTSSSSAADFYRDGLFSKTGYTGRMTISNVSRSNEGLYRCHISGAGGSAESWLAVTAYIPPAPQDTTPQHQEIPPHPRHHGSIQLSVLLPAVFTVTCVAALLLAVGLLQCRKRKVACFSSETPTTGLNPVSERALVAEPHMDIYANITRPKKNRVSGHARVADPPMALYANIPRRKKKRVRPEANVADQNGTCAVVATKKKKARGSGEARVAPTNKAKRSKERGHRTVETPD